MQSIDSTILWEMSLPGVGCGHKFKIKSGQKGNYFVSSSGQLHIENLNNLEFQKNFTGEITFYDRDSTVFTAQFNNGVVGMIYFR